MSRRHLNTQESLALIPVPSQMTTHLWHIVPALRRLNCQPCRHLRNGAQLSALKGSENDFQHYSSAGQPDSMHKVGNKLEIP